MAPKKVDEPNIKVGNITDISGEVNIASGDIYKGFTAEQVSVLITQITSTFQPKKFDGRCPYKGLDVFNEEDAELFFGREKLVDDLVSRVEDSRTVFVTGPSGSGKSSLVRAGLIHALKQGTIPNSDRWLYATMKPGRDPFEALAGAFSRLKSPELGDYFQQNVSKPEILHKCAEAVLSEWVDQRLVLYIDQFEEVFTQLNADKAGTFIEMLAHAATVENGRVIILFSIRSDFISNCATYPQLNAILNHQFVQIGAMQPDELVSAIAQPALRVGLKIDPDLIAQIINDMQGEPGALPLMQFALKDLFDAQQAQGGIIALTLQDYLQRGGIRKALERHADQTFSGFDAEEQELARSIFTGLIEIGRGTQDTRRTALFNELIPANVKAEEVQAIVRKLADARLITTDEAAGNDTVTISHEKLIDAWPWLKKLVNENHDVIALQNEIAADAKEWDEHKRDASYLYLGARLVIAQEKIKNLTLSENSQTFLTTSIKTQEDARQKGRRTQRRILTGSLVFSVLVLGLLILALNQLNTSRAQQLGSQSQVAFAEQNYNLAALYAYQSNQIHQNSAADFVIDRLYYENFALGKSLIGPTAPWISWGYTSAAWSADGRLASASDDGNGGTVTIWNLQTGKPAQTLEGLSSVYSVAWSADGRLASGLSDGTVIIWDLKTGTPSQILKGHSSLVYSVAWSADGRLASASEDHTIIIWDLKTGRPALTLKGHSDVVNSVAWSADGRLASASWDGTIIIWDLKTSTPAETLKSPTDSLFTSVAWSLDGRLASAVWDHTVIIWDLKTGTPSQILKGHSSSVYSVAWSPDGRLASASEDRTIIIWDLLSDQPAQTLKGHTAAVSGVAWSPEGKLASASRDGTVIAWDLKTHPLAQTLKAHSSSVYSVAWSTDGRLASASQDGTVIIWDLKTNLPAQTFKAHTPLITSVAWSPDGKLASASKDGTVIIWDLSSGQPAQTLNGHSYTITSVAWSPDGKLASASYDGTIIIWDLKTGTPAQTLKGHTAVVYGVAWSPDGKLASASKDSTVIIWDLKTSTPAQTLKGHTDTVYSVAWSPDGRLASASWDGTVIVWDLKTSTPAQTLKGHTDAVYSVAWSPDGRLASASKDGTVIIWDLKTGTLAETLKGHSDVVTSVAWSPDDRLASASWDGLVKIARAELVNTKPCNWIYRNMTFDQWVQVQGALYVYQPACLNLSVPILHDNGPIPLQVLRSADTTDQMLLRILTTWNGRVILLGIVLVLLGILYLILRGIYKFISWLWRVIYRRIRKLPQSA